MKLRGFFVTMCLCIAVLCLLAPTKAEAAVVTSGTCGTNLTWELNDEGTLTISGTGAMDNWQYGISDRYAPWYSKSGSITKLVIEEGVTTIGNFAFVECSSLVTAQIADSVTVIGNNAFNACSSLTSAPLPKALVSLGDYAFSGCDLDTIILPDSLVSIGNDVFSGNSRAFTVYDKAYYVGNGENPYLLLAKCMDPLYITDCQIHPDTKWIGGSAFYQAINLQTIVIPDGVTRIGDDAFTGCWKLAMVTFGADLTSIGDSAFYDCQSLMEVKLGDKVAHIGKSAFSECSALETVRIPDSLTSIGTNAFQNDRSLEYNESDSILYLGNESNPYVLLVTHRAIETATYQIQESTRVISDGAFRYGQYITEITIPHGVVFLGESAFESCGGLTEITLSDSLTAIARRTFYGCYSLTDITIGNNITTIGYGAFLSCGALTKVTIGTGLEFVDTSAFNCKNLTDVYYLGSEAQWAQIVINDYNDPLRNAAIHYNFTPNARIPGDLDDTEGVTTEDVVALLLYISMPDMFALPEGVSADFTGDGFVTTDDAVKLLLHISMPDLFPL